MFNCPEWGIGVEAIDFQASGGDILGLDTFNIFTVNSTITSCEQLVRMCFQFEQRIDNSRVLIGLQFIPNGNAISLGEVAFFDDGTPCPPDVIITPDDTSTTATGTDKFKCWPGC
jgi:hypothetical protein